VARGLRDFLRFSVVGAGGLAVDVGVFLAVLALGSDAYLARAVSALAAITATWWLHKEWTFRQPGHTARRGTYPAYVAVQSGGLAVNYGVFVAVLAVVPPGPLPSVFALGCGAAVALVFNFAGARGIVFRRPS
jgi:putative flippase GtrA